MGMSARCGYVHNIQQVMVHSWCIRYESISFLQVIVFQAYKNNSTLPIEAKYVFPLDDMAAGM